MTPEQRESFDANGYVMIENAIEGEDLERVQEVFLEGQAETRAKWEADGCPRGFFDIPNVLERDDIFLDLMHYKSTFPVMEEVIGPDIQLMGIQARTYPPNPTSYTNWHKDCPPWSHPQYALKSKLFYYLFDVVEDGGCTSFVPGKHQSIEDIPKYETPEEMPGHVKMTAKAGTAVIFDTRLWHTAMTNVSANPRVCLIYNYVPFWFKQYAGTIEQAQRLDERVTDPMRRQLLGLERVKGGNPYVVKVA